MNDKEIKQVIIEQINCLLNSLNISLYDFIVEKTAEAIMLRIRPSLKINRKSIQEAL